MEILSIVVSVLALGLASYSLYLQRKDRKPKLNLEVTKAERRRSVPGEAGGQRSVMTPCVTLRLSNPTDKAIKVRKVVLTARDSYPVTLFENSYPDTKVSSHSDVRLDWSIQEIN